MKILLSECSLTDNSVAAEWKAIYETNPLLGPLNSYEFCLSFVKNFNNNKARRSLKPFIVRAADSKRGTLMFLPLAKSHHNYYMLYDHSSIPYCDAVMRSDIKKEELDYIFDHLSELLGNETLYFTKMNSSSNFTKYLHERFSAYKKRECGYIKMLRSFDHTFQLLYADCRENITEARAKISDASLEFQTDIYFEKPLPVAVYKDIFNVVYGDNDSFFGKIKNKIYEKKNPVTIALRNGERSVCAVSYLDGFPVACLCGFSRNKELTVTKLVTSKYGVGFSSKHLILCDIIKYLIEKKKYSVIDLCRLDDKVKSDFCSEKHYVYGFEIKL